MRLYTLMPYAMYNMYIDGIIVLEWDENQYVGILQ